MTAVVISAMGAAAVIGALLTWLLRYRKRRMGPRTSRESLLVEALERLVKQDEEGAFESLRTLAAEPNAPPALYVVLAGLLRRRGDLERSAQVLSGVLARPSLSAPDQHRVKLELAGDMTALGREEDARQLIESLPKALRRDPQALALSAEVATRQGEWREAIAARGAHAKRTGEFQHEADRYTTIANEALSRGELAAAEEAFQRALHIDRANLKALWGMVQLGRRHNDPKRAQRYLLQMLAENPDLAPVLLSELDSAPGEPSADASERSGILDKLGKVKGLDLWIGLEKAENLAQRDRLDDSRQVIEGLVETHPRSIDAHEAYVTLLTELEDWEGLREEARRLVDLAAEEIRRFRCGACGFTASKPFMHCAHCGAFGSLGYDG